jgi:hypothetical protein
MTVDIPRSKAVREIALADVGEDGPAGGEFALSCDEP